MEVYIVETLAPGATASVLNVFDGLSDAKAYQRSLRRYAYKTWLWNMNERAK